MRQGPHALRSTLAIACVVFVALTLAGCRPRPAGIVLYHRSGDQVYLLLADHAGRSSRGWSAFGGGPHLTETPAETAARETEEETRGFFPRTDLLRLIEPQEPVIDTNGFALFFAEIDSVPAARIGAHAVPRGDRSYRERGPYAWVPYAAVEPYVGQPVDEDRRHRIDRRYLPDGCERDWLWTAWLHNLRRAVEQDALPWEQE